MKDIFTLYYYEMKKNKNILFSILILVILFVFTNISLSLFMIFNTEPDIVREEILNFLEINNLSNSFSRIVGSGDMHYYNFDDFIYSMAILIIVAIYSISIVASIWIVLKDYAKKNRGILVYSNLPISIFKYKISKIFAGFSIYIFTMVSLQIAFIILNLIYSCMLGNYYDASLVNMVGIGLPLNFSSFYSNIHFVFVSVFFSIVFLQSLVSILFIHRDKTKYLRRIMCVVLVLLYMILIMVEIMFLYLVGDAISISYVKSDILLTSSLLIIILAIITFIIDLKVSNKRERGGIE